MAKQGMRDAECSLFIANLDPRVSEEILWELFLQAGPIKSIHIPCDKESGKQKLYAFVEFSSRASAHYAWELLDGIRLYDRELTVRPQHSENSGETARHLPTNQHPAKDFYKYLYDKYEELQRRPQSEPRRGRWNEESSQRNHSFSHPTLNRSFSLPSNIASNISPPMNQLLNSIINAGTTSTPQRVPNHQPRPFWNVSPYGGSPQYGNSASQYQYSPSSNTSNRSLQYGYNSPSQGQQYYRR